MLLFLKISLKFWESIVISEFSIKYHIYNLKSILNNGDLSIHNLSIYEKSSFYVSWSHIAKFFDILILKLPFKGFKVYIIIGF